MFLSLDISLDKGFGLLKVPMPVSISRLILTPIHNHLFDHSNTHSPPPIISSAQASFLVPSQQPSFLPVAEGYEGLLHQQGLRALQGN